MEQRFEQTLDSTDRVRPASEGATLFLSSPVTPAHESDTLIGLPAEPAQTMALAILPRPAIGADASAQPEPGTTAEGATQFIASPFALPAGPSEANRRSLPLKAALVAGVVVVVGLGALVARNQLPFGAEVAEPPALVEEVLPDSLTEAAGAATVARLDVRLGQEPGDAAEAGQPLPLEPQLASVAEQLTAELAAQPNRFGLDSEQVGVQAERLMPAEPRPATEIAAQAASESAAQEPAEAVVGTSEPASAEAAETAGASQQQAETTQESGGESASLPDQAAVEQAAAVVEQQTLPVQRNERSADEDNRDRNGQSAISQYAPSGSAASQLRFGR